MAKALLNFGFRNGMGPRKTLFAENVLVQRCRYINKDVYIGFIDYLKTLDTVNHDVFICILNELVFISNNGPI